jgi:hypothetical protein
MESAAAKNCRELHYFVTGSKTVSQLDDGADDGGCFDLWSIDSRMIFQFIGVVQRPGRAVLPKIDSFAEPVKVIIAALQV